MNPRHLPGLLTGVRPSLFLTPLLALLPARAAAATPTSRPNILFLLADDQAYAAIGASGNTEIKTPNLDRLAAEGVFFERHYDTTAICMASRAEIMTGMYEYKTGSNFMHGSLTRAKFMESYPMLLKAAGYRVGFAGKFGFPVTDRPDSSDHCNSYDRLPVHDFDWWAGGIGQTSYVTAKNKYIARYAKRFPHSTRAYAAAAIDFLRESAKDGRPFCLSISFKAPHLPFTPDPFFDHVYEDVTFKKPANYGRLAAAGLAPQSKLGRQWVGRLPNMWGPDRYQKTKRLYYQLIFGVDYAVGEIRAELQRDGLAKNTIIIYTSDNGYYMGSHGFGGKVLLYQEGARAPLIIYDPRLPAADRGRRCTSLTANVDLAPTILDYAGVRAPAEMDGHSLVPLVENPARSIRNSLALVQAWGSAGILSLGIVSERWEYIYWLFGEHVKPTEELFDLKRDPGELNNVAGVPANAAELNLMRARYDEELARWRQQSVSYNDYPVFATLYDRHISWAKKKDLVPKRFMDTYRFWQEFARKHHLGPNGEPLKQGTDSGD